MILRWTGPALRNLDEIGDDITRDGETAGARTLTAVLDQTEVLRPQQMLPGSTVRANPLRGVEPEIAGLAAIAPLRRR
jgi:hypothetical protein